MTLTCHPLGAVHSTGTCRSLEAWNPLGAWHSLWTGHSLEAGHPLRAGHSTGTRHALRPRHSLGAWQPAGTGRASRSPGASGTRRSLRAFRPRRPLRTCRTGRPAAAITITFPRHAIITIIKVTSVHLIVIHSTLPLSHTANALPGFRRQCIHVRYFHYMRIHHTGYQDRHKAAFCPDG